MRNTTSRESTPALSLGRILDIIRDGSAQALPEVMDWVDHITPSHVLVPQRNLVREIIADRDNPWNEFLSTLWDDIDGDCRAAIFENLVLNAGILGHRKRERFRREHDCNVPWAILMDPVSDCNLHCAHCQSPKHDDGQCMGISQMDSIVSQGKEMGTYVYIFSGGEPLLRREDILRLCRKHSDCLFMAVTNGTLIDEAFANQMLQVKNLIPLLTVTNKTGVTNTQRGYGSYRRMLQVMNLLQENRLLFGATVCYTAENTHVVGHKDFFDFLIDLGCKFALYFTYVPVGIHGSTDLMATAQQREFMYHQLRRFRCDPEMIKPILTLDFWNDAEYIEGCIAGGRHYLHINATGDIEPCAFTHYSDSNIHSKTLLEAYKSPLFQAYRQHQPFNDNHLRACPLLDNIGVLSDLIHRTGAHSTDLIQSEDVDSLCAKCKYTAERWAPVAQRLWTQAQQEMNDTPMACN